MATGHEDATGAGLAVDDIEIDDGRRPVRELIEFAKCSGDAAYFIDEHLTIEDTHGLGDGTGTMPFKLWPAQVGLAWTLMAERLVIILKARQLGISWLCCGYALWHCLFAPNKTALLFSQGQEEANELLRRIKFLHATMPDRFREMCPAIVMENTTAIVLANGSRIRSLPATQKAGRSLTASLVVLDEAAFLAWGEALYTALKPTIDGAGQLIVLSTANGVGNLFHNLWRRAQSGVNSFKPVFLPWWSRPGRDQAWYDAQVSEEIEPGKVQQEYPANFVEAFRVSGRTRFSQSWIEAQSDNLKDGIPTKTLPADLRAVPGLSVYEPPWHPPLVREPRKCVIGADVAEGLEGGDYSDAAVLDAETWEELASLHGHWEPDEFARYLQALGDHYDARIAVERNNHGHAVLATLKGMNSRRVATGLDGRPGWHTTVQTKPMMIDLLATALRDGSIVVRSADALAEMQVYRTLANGSTGAPQGFHDDRVMSRAIALMATRHPAQRALKVY